MAVAIVTGGSSGIGKEICLELYRSFPITVVNISRSREANDGPDLPYDDRLIYEECDVSYIHHLISVVTHYEPAILVNNAGVLPLKDYLLQSPQDYNIIVETNLMAPVFATQACLPSMLKRGRGKIVNIASASGFRAEPGCPIYGASKAALIHFTQSIAGQYGHDGIQCNCVCPGMVNTKLCGGEPLPASELAKIPGGRIIEPREIAWLVTWILRSECLNGAVIVADMGKSHSVYRWEE